MTPAQATRLRQATTLALALIAFGAARSQDPGAPEAPTTVEIVGTRTTVKASTLGRDAGLPGAAVPAWVELAEADDPAVDDQPWRLVERHLRVHSDGASTFVVRHVIDITDSSVLDEAAVLDISIRPQFEALTLHRAAVHRNGKWSDRLRSSRIADARRERSLDLSTLDGRASQVVVLDDLRIGDRLELIWSIRGRDPALLGAYSGGLRLDDGPSVARSRLRVVVDPGVRLSYRASGGVPAPTRLSSGDLLWDLSPPPTATTLPEDLPGDAALSVTPRVQLSTFETWEEVANWAAELYRIEPPPAELRLVAERLAAIHHDRNAQILAALHWVQAEIRYFAVHLDDHTLRPHGLDEILQRRYGDCKDQAVLLVGLLRQLGVSAVPLLVDATAPGSAYSSLPSPAPFDHVIVMLPEDRRFLDPTLDLVPTSNLDSLWLPRYVVGLPALRGAGLVEIPRTSSFEGEVTAASSYTIAPDAAFSVEIVTTQTGRLAQEERQLLVDGSEALAEQYLAWYDQPGFHLAGEPLQVEDGGPGEPLTVRERYRATPIAGRQTVPLLPLELEALLPVPADDRTLPLLLPLPRRHHERVRIEAPEGWTCPAFDISVSNQWFRFRAGSAPQPSGFEISYELDLVGDAVASEDLPAYRAAVAEVATAFDVEVEANPRAGAGRWVWALGAGVVLLLLIAALRFHTARRGKQL